MAIVKVDYCTYLVRSLAISEVHVLWTRVGGTTPRSVAIHLPVGTSLVLWIDLNSSDAVQKD
jgi:hypothetical protein